MIRRLLFILILFFASHCYALDPVMQQIITEGSSAAVCYDYWGWPDTATPGTPDAVIGTWSDYENVADRVYGIPITVPAGGGTIVAINIGYGVNVTTDTNGAWLVVYNNGTKIAQVADLSPSSDSWTGFLDVTPVAVLESAPLVAGLAFDGDTSNLCGIAYDSGGSATKMQYEDEVTVGASGPDSSLTFAEASTAHAGAVMLKVQVTCP